MSKTITYDKQPIKFLKKLETSTAKRIIDKLDKKLEADSVPSDAKSIIWHHGVFRLRIGDYRALYRINYEEKRIVIFKLEKRSKVY